MMSSRPVHGCSFSFISGTYYILYESITDQSFGNYRIGQEVLNYFINEDSPENPHDRQMNTNSFHNIVKVIINSLPI
jgi:hypothetical protein